MEAEGEIYDGGVKRSGPQIATFGSTKAMRVQNAFGKFYEANAAGRIFRAVSASAGIAPGTALATTAQALCVWNPKKSGVKASIIQLAHAYVSGTFGLGTWYLANYSVNEPATNLEPGGTELLVSRADGELGKGKIRVFSAATCTAAPIIAEPLDWEGVLDGTGATQVGSSRIFRFDGDLVVSPGTACIMTFVGGAGTAPKVVVGAKWDEIPE